MALAALVEVHDIPFFRAWPACINGWALAMQGQTDVGIAKMREALEVFSRIGAVLGRPMMQGLLAQAYGQSGQPEAGLEQVDIALEAIEKNGEHFWQAELYRVRGELLAQIATAPTGLAEASLQQAIDTRSTPGR